MCVAAAAFAAPEAYGIGVRGAIHGASLVEMAIGLAIGAITFTGSIVAFAKLQGLVTGRPLVFPGQHPLNAALGVLLILLIVLFVIDRVGRRLRAAGAAVAGARLPADRADRRRRHAGRDLDAELLFGLGGLPASASRCRTAC